MVGSIRLLLLALAGVGCFTPTVSAGWVCIKNELKVAVVLQEVPDRPRLRRGKVVKLLPGEVYREYHPAAGERRVQVFESRDPDKPLCSTKLTWPATGDVSYKLEAVKQVVRLDLIAPNKSPVPPTVQVGSAKPADSPKR
jgi:hypothetical protein